MQADPCVSSNAPSLDSNGESGQSLFDFFRCILCTCRLDYQPRMKASEGVISIPPLQRSWRWGWGGVGILVSPCPSVHLWTESCPLCIFHNTSRIHFIFAHLIDQLHEVCRVLRFLKKIQNLNFWQFFQNCNFDLVFCPCNMNVQVDSWPIPDQRFYCSHF